MNDDEKYAIANKLASDLAVDAIASDISNTYMGLPARKIAENMRKKSDDNIDQGNSKVQEYRRCQSYLYSMVWDLLDGSHGYKLVEDK